MPPVVVTAFGDVQKSNNNFNTSAVQAHAKLYLHTLVEQSHGVTSDDKLFNLSF